MKRVIPIVVTLVVIAGTAHAGWMDRVCQKYPTLSMCSSYEPPTEEPHTPTPTPPPSNFSVTLTEVEAVPDWTDESPTYVFNSSAAGNIVYGGSCGNGDKAQAVAGSNTVTWKLAEGTYSDCTVKVGASNTLRVPIFESTSKYPVVFVHGLGGSSRAWDSAKAYLTGQGWDPSLLVARSITESNSTLCGTVSANQAAEVAGWVDDVLDQFPGFEKVDLVGHSRGGSNIMRALWHGYIPANKVRHVVTLAGANRACGSYYPAIPADETTGSIKFSVYYSDGTPDYDTAVDYSTTNVKGAYISNLWPLSHSEIRQHATAMQALRNSLLGTYGSN